MELGVNYRELIIKIDGFIRKYYLNKVVRGCIYLAASLFITYLIVTLTEFYGNFSPLVRTVLFYSFIILNAALFIFQVCTPLLSYFRLGKIISVEQAAVIIGAHFSNVSDKLLNTLQLKKLAEQNPSQIGLIEASIRQKTSELRPVPFSSAIRINENKRYLKFAAAPFIVILIIAFTAPSIFSESTTRLISYNKVFIKKAPFQFIILNKSLNTVQGNDFTVQLKMTGNEIPGDIYLVDGANSFKLDKKDIIHFEYTFKNVQLNKNFRFEASDYLSDIYTLSVIKKASLLNIEAFLEYPAYLNKKNEKVANFSDMSVPCGTFINWKIKAQNTDFIRISNGKEGVRLQNPDLNYSFRALQNTIYNINPENNAIAGNQSVSYKIDVIPDLNPTISFSDQPDSVNNKIIYFIGQVNDDYGFTQLNFHYHTITGGKSGKDQSVPVKFDKNAVQSSFLHFFNMNDAGAQPGDQIEYYFEVYDNDGVHGPKKTRSEIKTFSLPTIKEIDKSLDAGSRSVKQKIDQAIRQANQIQSESNRINQELINKKDLSFSDKKQIESLLEKRKDLEQLVKDIQKENKQNLFNRQDTKEEQQQLLEKQKQIEDLFNNVLDEKTKDILKNIQKFLDENNKTQTRDEISKMQLENKSLQKELDRILELYKKLEFDQKLSDAINKLQELSQEQKKLSDETVQKNADDQALKEKQDALVNDFNALKEQMDDLQKKDQELDGKNNFDNPEKEQQEITKQQQQSKEELANKNMKKASQNQQNAAQQMQQLSQKLESMQQKEESEENQINLQNLRQILDKLLKASFKQENVMQSLRAMKPADPEYVKSTEQQRDIKDNLKGVQDSLYQLSKRVPQIESVVNKEISAINNHIDKALDFLGDRRTAEANSDQQYAMTSINNLALMLSEVEEQLQQAMKNGKTGGKGKQQSLSQLGQMQDQLNKNMQKARQQMQHQGQQTPGIQGNGMSEQFSKMARQQQLIRQSLQEIDRQMNKDGKGSLGDLNNLTKQMEQTETDLVNKRIQQETISRQQDILTKLLDADKADREREMDQKRESKQGIQTSYNYKTVLEEYKKSQRTETEFLKTVTPSLSTFYKLKVEDYFKFLNSVK